MASGFDSRQGTRQTFAFQGTGPVQARPGASGASAGAQIVGGQSSGGMVAAGPQTDAPASAGQLGQFFEGLMQPYIERKQQEKFFEGFTMAQEGVALEELNNSDSNIKTIFGPTAFEQGAQFFTAKATLDTWTKERYADMDRLKTLDPKEAAKELAATSRSLMTQDPFANQMIQSGLIEATGPLMNAVSKARYAWQQETALKATTTSWNTGASALQAAAQAQAKVSSPTDGPSTAVLQQSRAFLDGMTKPEGMADETYRTGLYHFMRGAMQEGNFYAVNLMRKSGIDKVFTEEEQVKLADAEHRYAERVMEGASMELLVGDMKEYEDLRAHGYLTPLSASNAMMAMNAKLRHYTGIEEDLFDFADMEGEVRSIADMVVAARRRAEDRAWQLEDRQYREDRADQRERQDDVDASRAAGAGWASGDVSRVIAEGVEEKHFNRIALKEFREGKYAGLARAFRVGHYTSNAVKNDIQGVVEGSLEEQYGKNFAGAHRTWQAMLKVSPGMTASYYGDYHEKMRAFDTLSRQLGPEAAYRRAFGDPARYSAAKVPPELRKEATAAVKAAVAAKQPSSWNPFARQYSAQAQRVMEGLITERVAMGLSNSDTPAGPLATEALSAALADGSLQTAGGEAWRAAPGTKPFRVQIGLQQDEADSVFRAQVDFRLKRAGLQAGIKSTLDINYVQAPNGSQVLHIIGRDNDGNSANILIPMQAFKDEHAHRIRNASAGRRANEQARTSVRNGLDPYRRIPGESGLQRTIRINREVAQGGDPVNHFK